jgi:hypothetical protein
MFGLKETGGISRVTCESPKLTLSSGLRGLLISFCVNTWAMDGCRLKMGLSRAAV